MMVVVAVVMLLKPKPCILVKESAEIGHRFWAWPYYKILRTVSG